MFTGLLYKLEKNLKQLPGIGTKSAQRLAMYIINMEKNQGLELADSIKNAIANYKHCSICNMLDESDPCHFCKDKTRDQNTLCIVETTRDVYFIEKTNEYKGMFFVLGKLLSPIDGIGPNEINFPKLRNLIPKNDIKEIILALNPSAEGESTMSFISTHLDKLVNKITRLSTGLPFGGDIEYTTALTLSNAIKRRYSVNEI